MSMMKARLDWRGGEIARALARAAPRALFRSGEVIRAASILEAPLDEGGLIASSITDAAGKTAAVSYDAPGAVRWHEHDADFQHGRKKKYLEDPVNDRAVQGRALRSLADALREEVGL